MKKIVLKVLLNVTIILYTTLFSFLVWVLVNKGDHSVATVFVLVWLITVVWILFEYEKYKKGDEKC